MGWRKKHPIAIYLTLITELVGVVTLMRISRTAYIRYDDSQIYFESDPQSYLLCCHLGSCCGLRLLRDHFRQGPHKFR